jgi:hypothetical protein
MVKNTYKGGHAGEFTINRSIIRYSMFMYDTSRTQTSGTFNTSMVAILSQAYDGFHRLRVYHNAFLGSPNKEPSWPHIWTLFTSDDGNTSQPIGNCVYANNEVLWAGDTTLWYYQDRTRAYNALSDTAKGNLFWNGSVGGKIIDIMTSGSDAKKTLAEAVSYNGTFFQASNFEASPLFVDSLSRRGVRSFALASNSPCIDRAVSLTQLRAATVSAKTVDVKDARFFWYNHDGNPYDRGDSIMIGSVRAEIDSVDTTNNRILTVANVSVSAGDSVWVLATYNSSTGIYTNRLQGARPDVGPYEYPSTSGFTQSVTVNWNNSLTPVSLTSDATVDMSNVSGRETKVLIHNPSGRTIQWPSNIIWPGVSSAPAMGDTVGVFQFIRENSAIYGFLLKN